MRENSDSQNRKIRSWWLFPTLLLLMFVLWAGSGVWISYYYADESSRGTFGDMFGAINALFSGAALVGIIYSINLQRRELEDTRVEIRRAANAHEETVKLNAYTAMLNAYSQQTNYLRERLDLHPSESMAQQVKRQIKERDYYANKIAELAGEELKQR